MILTVDSWVYIFALIEAASLVDIVKALPTGGDIKVPMQRSPVLAPLALICVKVSPVLCDYSQKAVGPPATLTFVFDVAADAVSTLVSPLLRSRAL